jgi:hypothetical protein
MCYFRPVLSYEVVSYLTFEGVNLCKELESVAQFINLFYIYIFLIFIYLFIYIYLIFIYILYLFIHFILNFFIYIF